ncbi:hypothetical protein [Arthrobacter sp. SD76]|uniref:hypothetical protein n=1 Tax=Arthrobacter sp. SD76 TaxID=3415007 RepID=UPI003C78DC21
MRAQSTNAGARLNKKTVVHATSGILALLIILAFWISTASVEIVGDAGSIVALKRTIPWGLLLLVPALVTTGLTGTSLARGASGSIVRAKTLRMRAAAGIGILVLAPSALYLGLTAEPDQLVGSFYAVQAVELCAGATNIVLLSLNTRDGFRLSGRFKSRKS